MKEFAGSSYKTSRLPPSQGKPCRVSSTIAGDVIRQIWSLAAEPQIPAQAHPHSSWLSLVISNSSINAACESHWHRCDLSSSQKPSAGGFLSSAPFLTSLHHEWAWSHPGVSLHLRPGRVGQWFLGKGNLWPSALHWKIFSLQRGGFGFTLKSSTTAWRRLGCFESCLTALQELTHCTHSERRLPGDSWDRPKGGNIPPNHPWGLKSIPSDWHLSKPSLSAKFKRKPRSSPAAGARSCSLWLPLSAFPLLCPCSPGS